MAKKPPPIKSSIVDGIASREAEIEAKKSEILHKKESGDILLIPINKIREIVINGKEMHNRSAYSIENIKELARKIKHAKESGAGVFGTGLLNPITVRISKDGKYYERIAGFRRIKSFEVNEEEFIPAIAIEADDGLARELRNDENSEREKLNPYDELIGVMEELSLRAGFSDIDELRNFLNMYNNHFSDKKSFQYNEHQLEQLGIIETTLERIGKWKIKTLNNRMRMLSLHHLIKEQIVDNRITYSNAVLVNKLKNNTENVQQVLKKLDDYKHKNDSDMPKVEVEKLIENFGKKTKENTIDIAFSKPIITKRIYGRLDQTKKQEVDVILQKIIDAKEELKNIIGVGV